MDILVPSLQLGIKFVKHGQYSMCNILWLSILHVSSRVSIHGIKAFLFCVLEMQIYLLKFKYCKKIFTYLK